MCAQVRVNRHRDARPPPPAVVVPSSQSLVDVDDYVIYDDDVVHVQSVVIKRTAGTFPKFPWRQRGKGSVCVSGPTPTRSRATTSGRTWTPPEKNLRFSAVNAPRVHSRGTSPPVGIVLPPQSWRPRRGGGTLGRIFKSSWMEWGVNATFSPKTIPHATLLTPGGEYHIPVRWTTQRR